MEETASKVAAEPLLIIHSFFQSGGGCNDATLRHGHINISPVTPTMRTQYIKKEYSNMELDRSQRRKRQGCNSGFAEEENQRMSLLLLRYSKKPRLWISERLQTSNYSKGCFVKDSPFSVLTWQKFMYGKYIQTMEFLFSSIDWIWCCSKYWWKLPWHQRLLWVMTAMPGKAAKLSLAWSPCLLYYNMGQSN